MKLYPERPGAALRKVTTDVLVVLWVYLWVRLAMGLYDTIEKLAAPGRTLAKAGDGMAAQFADAGNKVGRVPIAGDSLEAPFKSAGDAARQVADAGREQQAIVHDAALALALALLILPIGLVLFWWLPRRLRWIRRATAATKIRGASAGKDLLALRALVTQPLTKLAKIDPDIAAAWRRGDATAVNRLASLELEQLGLR